MESKKRYLFVSYAREDLEIVQDVVEALATQLQKRAIPVDIWIDTQNLTPGESWNEAISHARAESIGLLFFVSPESLQSSWALKELEFAAKSSGRMIIPVILRTPKEMPESLMEIQWLDFTNYRTKKEIDSGGKYIADAVQNYLERIPRPKSLVSRAEAHELAGQFANKVRAANEPGSDKESQHSVFLVHGHNIEARSEVENYLEDIGITPIVLSRLDQSAQSLFQKFMLVAQKARFAVVLLSSDDYGASRRQYETEGVTDKSLQFRARQNVILELGFFYGRLGWENVYVIYRNPDKVFPNFERPSDLDGVVFDSMSSPKWKRNLKDKLLAADFVSL